MGAFVGTTALRDGAGVMVDWTYEDGADYLPSDEEVRELRPPTDAANGAGCSAPARLLADLAETLMGLFLAQLLTGPRQCRGALHGRVRACR